MRSPTAKPNAQRTKSCAISRRPEEVSVHGRNIPAQTPFQTTESAFLVPIPFGPQFD
jgi:hypothetical protein